MLYLNPSNFCLCSVGYTEGEMMVCGELFETKGVIRWERGYW